MPKNTDERPPKSNSMGTEAVLKTLLLLTVVYGFGVTVALFHLSFAGCR